MEYGPRPRPIFFGLALITVGVLFLLREMDVLPDISLWTLLWLGLGGWLLVGPCAPPPGPGSHPAPAGHLTGHDRRPRPARPDAPRGRRAGGGRPGQRGAHG